MKNDPHNKNINNSPVVRLPEEIETLLTFAEKDKKTQKYLNTLKTLLRERFAQDSREIDISVVIQSLKSKEDSYMVEWKSTEP